MQAFCRAFAHFVPRLTVLGLERPTEFPGSASRNLPPMVGESEFLSSQMMSRLSNRVRKSGNIAKDILLNQRQEGLRLFPPPDRLWPERRMVPVSRPPRSKSKLLASRQFRLSKKQAFVDLMIPQICEDRVTYYCWSRLRNLPEPRSTIGAFGFGAFQAFILCYCSLHSVLLEFGNALKWEGASEGQLGMPLVFDPVLKDVKDVEIPFPFDWQEEIKGVLHPHIYPLKSGVSLGTVYGHTARRKSVERAKR